MKQNNITVKRKELKYYISYQEYIVLSKKLEKVLTRDNFSKTNEGYLISSLYFDSLDNKEFEDKMEGIEHRKKYRLRLYSPTDKEVKFEIKQKQNETILKETAKISSADAVQIQKRNYEVLLKYNNPILNKIYVTFKKKAYRPVTLVNYRREAFTFPINNVRIVFDKYLKTSTTQLDLFQSENFHSDKLKRGLVIMEVKYNQFLPSFIRDLIQVPAADRSAISKYCIGRLDQFQSIF